MDDRKRENYVVAIIPMHVHLRAFHSVLLLLMQTESDSEHTARKIQQGACGVSLKMIMPLKVCGGGGGGPRAPL